MRTRLNDLLDHVERVLDPVRQERVSALFRRVLGWEAVGRLPVVLTYPFPAEIGFELYRFSEACDDPAKMLYNELVYAFDSSIACRNLVDDDLPCTIRANFGTVVVASLFGGKIEQIENNPPWVRPSGSADVFQRILDCDPCDFGLGLCPRVIETYEFYRSVLAERPGLGRCIKVVLPDLQGPFDTAEQLRGSGIYEDLYVNSENLGRAMHHIAQAQVGLAKRLQLYLNDGPEGYSHQHNSMICGNILIRNDCAINVSPEMYRHQITPHDSYVLESLGGGGIHCCGRCEHLADEFIALPAVECIDLGQSEMNDVGAIYGKARRGGVRLIRIRVSAEELRRGRIASELPTGVTLVCRADSLDQARQIMEAYRRNPGNGEAQ
ncbi:MAG: hypothetical protein JXN61_15420 [Sedimentisphaerales bacterium]|nr:hypothetical protein [Sedimentisphaerales bacterium]